jgi:hypothetical protein
MEHSIPNKSNNYHHANPIDRLRSRYNMRQ